MNVTAVAAQTQEQQSTNGTANATAWYGLNSEFGFNSEVLWKRWIILEVTVGFLTLLNLYVVVALSISQRKILTWSRRGRSTDSIDEESTRKIVIATLLAAVFNTLRQFSLEIELISQVLRPAWCNSISMFRAVVSNAMFVFIYLSMWFRQRVLYTRPSIRHLTNIPTRTLSILIFPFVAIGHIANTTLFVCTQTYFTTPRGCKPVPNDTIPIFITWINLMIISFSGQTVLVGLFLYPLIRHRNAMKDVRSANDRKDEDNMMPLIRRAFGTSLSRIIFDIMATVTRSLIFTEYGLTSIISHSLSMSIGVMLAVFSFSDWKQKLCL